MHNENGTVLIGETVAGQSAKVRKKVVELIKNANAAGFDLAETLLTIKKNNFYEGFNTFNEYLKSLKFKIRRLRYLVKMAETMDQLEIPREKYEPLGISKLRDITSLDPAGVWTNPETQEQTPLKAFIIGFVDKGQQMTIEEIRQHVRTLKGEIGDEAFVILHIKIKQGALDKVVRPALELMKMHLGSSGKDEEGKSFDASDGKALEMICADYSSDPANNPIMEGNEE